MKIKKPTQLSVIPNEEGKNNMNIQIISKSMKKILGYLLVLLAILTLSACTSQVKAAGSSCNIDMGMRVTIDVTDVKPRVLFDLLARELGCDIPVSPFIWKHVTLHVENATVAEVISSVCQQIGCKYILNDNRLSIKPLTIVEKMNVNYWEKRNRILQSRLPDGMSFENVPLSTVLKEISKATGLVIKPWKDEGDRLVSIDVSGMIVNEALKAVVLAVDGEGAVLIKMGGLNRSYGQHWLWGYPPP
jgi:hypothetical protein